jgi:hypothetical protein
MLGNESDNQFTEAKIPSFIVKLKFFSIFHIGNYD